MPKCKQSKKYKILLSICINIVALHGSLIKFFFSKNKALSFLSHINNNI